jgi:hypothetical protein
VNRRLGCLGAVLFVLADAGAGQTIHRLQIVDAGGATKWEAPVRPGERFDLTYIHSSERCRWTQHYTAGPGMRITQTASTFPCFGAGMPVAGEVLRRSAEGFTVAAPRSVDAVDLMQWAPAGITLRYRHRAIPISSWFADYDAFSIRIR